MANLPIVLRLQTPNYYTQDSFPHRIYDNLHPTQQRHLEQQTLAMLTHMQPQPQRLTDKEKDDMPQLAVNHQENFEIHLDVARFHPDDITVKFQNDSIIVEGKHDEREDEHGHVTRHFTRRYEIPIGFDIDAIQSTLTIDGVLEVMVPKILSDNGNARIVQIKHVDAPSKFIMAKTDIERKTIN